MPTHNHCFRSTFSTDEDGLCGLPGTNESGMKSGTFAVIGVTDDADADLPFMQLPACEYSGTATDNLPKGTISYMNSASCPSGWQALADYARRTIVAVDSTQTIPGIAGDQADATLEYSAVHAHSMSGSVTVNDTQFILVSGSTCSTKYAKAGNYDFTCNAEVGGNGDGIGEDMLRIPAASYGLCKKLSAPSSKALPPSNMIVFFEATACPVGWTEVVTMTNRFLIGLPDDGKPGIAYGGKHLDDLETRSHEHGASSDTINFPAQNVTAWNGKTGVKLGASGNYAKFSGGTTLSSATPAYVQLLGCRKN